MPVYLTQWMLLNSNYKLSIGLQSQYFNNKFEKDFDI